MPVFAIDEVGTLQSRVTTSAIRNRAELSFTPNVGQWKNEILYRATAPSGTIWFTREGLTYQFVRYDTARAHVAQGKADRLATATDDVESRPCEGLSVKASFIGSNPDLTVSVSEPVSFYTNYFEGNDPKQWHARVPSYRVMTVHDLYPGIDLEYRASGKTFEYDLLVHPGADPQNVQIKYEGIDGLSADSDGNLVVKTRFGDIKESPPQIYQQVTSGQKSVKGHFKVAGANAVSFGVDEKIDSLKDLIIDPSLSFSTYLSGSDFDYLRKVVPDKNGDVIVTGITSSFDFPAKAGYDTTWNSSYDLFVSKLSASGSGLIFSTFLGGSGNEGGGYGAALKRNGEIWVAGWTQSVDCPVVNALDNSFNGGQDIYLARLSASGDQLLYGSYLGGSDTDRVFCMVLDRYQRVYLSGLTYSHNYPVTSNAYQGSYGGGIYDGITTVLDSTGANLLWSTYLGASGADNARGIAVDTLQNIYVSGGTTSPGFPTTAGAFQRTLSDSNDVFVTKFNPLGNGLAWSTFVGGPGDDFAYGITAGPDGRTYLTGYAGAGFPTTVSPPYAGNSDAFVAMMSSGGDSLLYSRYFGGPDGDDCGYGIALTKSGQVVVGGVCGSWPFPVTGNGFQQYHKNWYDGFLLIVDPRSNLLSYSTLFGGNEEDYARSVATDFYQTDSVAYLAGYTYSTDFPMLNALQPTGDKDTTITDGFVTKFSFVNSGSGGPSLVCGDVNGDGWINLADEATLISYHYHGGASIVFPTFNGGIDGQQGITLNDIWYLDNYLTDTGRVPMGMLGPAYTPQVDSTVKLGIVQAPQTLLRSGLGSDFVVTLRVTVPNDAIEAQGLELPLQFRLCQCIPIVDSVVLNTSVLKHMAYKAIIDPLGNAIVLISYIGTGIWGIPPGTWDIATVYLSRPPGCNAGEYNNILSVEYVTLRSDYNNFYLVSKADATIFPQVILGRDTKIVEPMCVNQNLGVTTAFNPQGSFLEYYVDPDGVPVMEIVWCGHAWTGSLCNLSEDDGTPEYGYLDFYLDPAYIKLTGLDSVRASVCGGLGVDQPCWRDPFYGGFESGKLWHLQFVADNLAAPGDYSLVLVYHDGTKVVVPEVFRYGIDYYAVDAYLGDHHTNIDWMRGTYNPLALRKSPMVDTQFVSIPSARATLYQYNIDSGAFVIAPTSIISPHTNPIQANIEGQLNWELPDGQYYLKVEARGFQTVNQSATFTVSPQMAVTVHMQPLTVDTVPPVVTSLLLKDADSEYFQISVIDTGVGVAGLEFVNDSTGVLKKCLPHITPFTYGADTVRASLRVLDTSLTGRAHIRVFDTYGNSAAQDLTLSCCIGHTGNVDGKGIVDLADLTALVSYLTGGGYVLPCPAEANVNATGIVDLADLTALVSYLTGGGFVLPNCPAGLLISTHLVQSKTAASAQRKSGK